MPSLCRDCGASTVGRGLCQRHYNAWYRANRITPEKRAKYQERFWSKPGRREEYNAKLRKPGQAKVCEECGGAFETAIPHKRFCSVKCRRRADGRRNRQPEPWNDRRRENYHRRRARKKGATTGRPVLLEEIRDRDESRCGICGEAVNGEVWPDPLSASLDHVISLSRGGIHDPDNVQLAHLGCNTQKNAA